MPSSSESLSPLRLLMIGPADASLVGGTAVSFRQLVERLQRRPDVELTVIDSSPRGGFRGSIVWAVATTWRLVRLLGRCDVLAFHASVTREKYFGPVVGLLCGCYRKPWVFRGFGGGHDLMHERMWPPMRWLFGQTVLHADAVLLQTKMLVEYFQERGFENVQWLPNSRPLPKTQPAKNRRVADSTRRFIFVGRIEPDKGVREILRAAKSLGDAVNVDFFGPLAGGLRESEFDLANVDWHGALPPDEIAARLPNYDALVLPTYYEGEGYPGAILEAFAAGVPVIATRWRAIAEIVDETCGMLVEPRSAESLAGAMRKLVDSPDTTEQLGAGAWRRAPQFDADHWAEEFLRVVRTTVR